MFESHEFLAADDRGTLGEILALPWGQAWPRIRRIWSEADEVCTDVVGSGRFVRETLAFALALEAVRRMDDIRPDLLEAVESADPRLAAYAIVCLDLGRKGKEVLPLPAGALDRPEKLEVRSGCFRSETSLGEFARSRLAPFEPPVDPRVAESFWAGRARACPTCGTTFTSVRNLGACPRCRHSFRAGDVHPTPG